MIRKLSLFLISSREDLYGRSCVRVLARALPPGLSGVALPSVQASSWSCCVESISLARQHAPPSAQTSPPTPLPGLSPRLSYLVGWRACACSCTLLARGEKPPRSPQADQDRGVRLSQPAVRVLRYQR